MKIWEMVAGEEEWWEQAFPHLPGAPFIPISKASHYHLELLPPVLAYRLLSVASSDGFHHPDESFRGPAELRESGGGRQPS